MCDIKECLMTGLRTSLPTPPQFVYLRTLGMESLRHEWFLFTTVRGWEWGRWGTLWRIHLAYF